ncbi:CarboxypepD_reg-like domain-containing protein [Filimonas lacunae]|uniref:CarboxypepD_reg-like domain-containing protein n=1 Tax=Filimonas lacunae TaxID=477680 RepID=A0A173MNV9_9BACT|nr:DUF5686 and carboxypeptidase regulatory-like domain-containing protein [Filimonas lacunae]BAV09081.1 hypothetical protein FLA_5129 [Filimonas lacunae]SIS67035.1 CarboxypepD_reg-like domain-containing protein [Filimonas lacunae]
MIKPIFCLTTALLCFFSVFAHTITGTVTDEKGRPLPYASVQVKGDNRGTTTNSQGRYLLEVNASGSVVIVCQYVGYARQEKTVSIEKGGEVNFQLQPIQAVMKEVVVKSGGEDPAYAIIRSAIKKRPDYQNPLDSFTCEAYIKTLVKTRKLPNRVLGQKIKDADKKEMGVDSAGKGIIYLSESLTKIAYKKPEQLKMEVISGRESGGNGYGFNFPTFINFYDNNVTVLTSTLAPRGFISPIADGALKYYRYKYLGSFWEEGKEITQIKVIPRRKYEPLFSGTINITEGEWRIHSLDLMLTKQSQLEMLDTLQVKQIHAPVTNGVWRTKDQSLYYTFNILGIDAVGNFLNVYNKYDTRPQFAKKYFNKILVAYDTAVNKKSAGYWDSIRPVQLEPDEIKDYAVKDSIYKQQQDSAYSTAYRDSLRRRQGRITVGSLVWEGFTRSNYHPQHPFYFTWAGPLKHFYYNSVEGYVVNLQASFTKVWKPQGKTLSFIPHVRYGFGNKHVNSWASLNYYRYPKGAAGGEGRAIDSWELRGGKRVSQFNPQNPIGELLNSAYTLLEHRNYMKIYENYFGELRYTKRFDSDVRVTGSILYENRMPLNNLNEYSYFKKDRVFSPNYPYEQLSSQFTKHQAVVANVEVQYKPGQRYIQYPKQKVAIGSKYPTFSLAYSKGIDNVLGSDVNFDKWRFAAWDKVNFKIMGAFSYRISVGGFLNNNKVNIQDYQHFNGNQTLFASEYLNSFQLAPYYANSTTASFFAEAHVEHHFNGLLTNKIPFFKKLNWHLVAGANAFRVNASNHYTEVFAGIENIFKVLRVDVVNGYWNGSNGTVGVRLGFGGLIGGSMKVQ